MRHSAQHRAHRPGTENQEGETDKYKLARTNASRQTARHTLTAQHSSQTLKGFATVKPRLSTSLPASPPLSLLLIVEGGNKSKSRPIVRGLECYSATKHNMPHSQNAHH